MQLKQCSMCHKDLPLSKFYSSKYSKDGYRSECKDCSKINNKVYYDTHRQQIINNVAAYAAINKEKIKQYQASYRENNSEKLKSYKLEHDEEKHRKIDSYKTPCAKCGETKYHVIDFHHIDPSTKCFTIGEGYRWNDEKIKTEVAKCICLCANCHREFHYLYGITPIDPVNQLAEYLYGDE